MKTKVLSIVLVVLVVWCVVWTNLSYFLFSKTIKPTLQPKEILFANFPTYYELGESAGPSLFKHCGRKCELSLDMNQKYLSDMVVVFSHEHISPLKLFEPSSKSPHQKWVLFAVESPPYCGHNMLAKKDFENKFDYMMSYRSDSDIWFGYIKTLMRLTPASRAEREADVAKMKQKFAKKSKLVAWFVSHCDTQSKRMRYVRRLQKHIAVDIYGKCGTLKCANHTICDQMLADDYKFYLSFENTLCKDYISEKVTNILRQGETVPVVRGGGDYSKICPPNSVVNTDDFSSPAKLAEYLIKLASNETEYIKKLEWGWDYEVINPKIPWCQLCDVAHDGDLKRKPYPNATKWWTDGACHAPTDIH